MAGLGADDPIAVPHGRGALRVAPSRATLHPGDLPRTVRPDEHVPLPTFRGGQAKIAAGPDTDARRVLLGAVRPASAAGPGTIEVVVDGWRFELVVEDAAGAELREIARRGRTGPAAGGPVEIRAIIPGRVIALSIAVGDRVAANQPILVLEAMKMQNEVRAPIAGRVERIEVGPGATVEVGETLVLIVPTADDS
jgi:biotin carboxyl carrier protein